MAFVFSTTIASAATYPWVPVGTDDIRIYESPEVELAARIHLATKVATKSIDVAIYDLRADERYTYPLLKALREAAERNIKVRFLASWAPQMMYDPAGRIPMYLTGTTKGTPVEFMFFGGPHSSVSWSTTDGMHEKLFIVDGKYALLSGRGFGDNTFNWLDTTFAVKGALANQTSAAFEDLWNTVASFTSPIRKEDNKWFTSGIHAADVNAPAESIRADEKPELESFKIWLTESSRYQPLPSGELAMGRVLHFDFIRQALWLRKMLGIEPADIELPSRLKMLNDPVLNELIDSINRSNCLSITTPSFNLVPELWKAISSLLQKNGGCSEVFVNGTWREGTSLESFPLWNMGLPHLDGALKLGAKGYALKGGGRWTFLHRKLAIVGEDEVFFGSHNFNYPSTVANDEISIQVKDSGFAGKARALTQHSLKHDAIPLDPAQVSVDNMKSAPLRTLLSPLIRIF